MTSQVLCDHTQPTLPTPSTQLCPLHSGSQPDPLGFSDRTQLPGARPLINAIPLAWNLFPMSFSKSAPPGKIFNLLYSSDPFRGLASGRGGRNHAYLVPGTRPASSAQWEVHKH